MACGKNAVSSILEKRGFFSIDCDLVVHEILCEERIVRCILDEFGAEAEKQKISLLKENGSLDRRALGTILFQNKKLLLRQEEIVYPALSRRLFDFLQTHKNAVINATLLWKLPEILEKCQAVIFVDTFFGIRFFRVKKRDSLPLIQIVRRFWAQKNLFSKYRLSNADIYKVDNSRSLDLLEKKIDGILQNFLKKDE